MHEVGSCVYGRDRIDHSIGQVARPTRTLRAWRLGSGSNCWAEGKSIQQAAVATRGSLYLEELSCFSGVSATVGEVAARDGVLTPETPAALG